MYDKNKSKKMILLCDQSSATECELHVNVRAVLVIKCVTIVNIDVSLGFSLEGNTSLLKEKINNFKLMINPECHGHT